MDNVTDLAAYRRRPPAPTVTRGSEYVTLTVGISTVSMTPEFARKLGEELIDAGNLIDEEK